MAQQKTITVSGADVSLFHVAARELGDATQWVRIAQANGMDDPMLAGVRTLLLPRPTATTTDGLPPQ